MSRNAKDLTGFIAALFAALGLFMALAINSAPSSSGGHQGFGFVLFLVASASSYFLLTRRHYTWR